MSEQFEVTLESESFSTERLTVRRMTGTERISKLFFFDVEIECREGDAPSAETMSGANVTLVVTRKLVGQRGWSGTRRIDGLIAELADRFSARDGVRTCKIRIVPRAFVLTLVETQDIFLELTVPQIVEQKLSAFGLKADMRLAGAYPPREFVVQYKESDLAFVSRLTEHAGVSFFFTSSDDGTKLTFTDHADGFPLLEGAETIVFDPSGEHREIFALEENRKIVPSYFLVRDYNYRKPHLDLTATHELKDRFGGGVVDYASHVKTPEEAKTLARIRAEERDAEHLVWKGQSSVPLLSAGARFNLEGHPELDARSLLLVEVMHEFETKDGAEPTYVTTFRAVPAEATFRPPRVTPRPRISGLLTAIVDDGGSGATKFAQIDDEGRYRVQFLFDMSQPDRKQKSRPVRMLQNHVGENHGTHFPLRPGIEVAIGFIDGDPDRPLIVGAIPNAQRPSPVTNALPGVHRIKTLSGIMVDMVEDL